MVLSLPFFLTNNSLSLLCVTFDSKFISSQFATLDDINTYATEIAPARTFVFVL